MTATGAAPIDAATGRERATDVFSQLRIWDTEHNNGMLFYLLLADRDVEIVADPGIHSKAGLREWKTKGKLMFRHILITTDGSPLGNKAAKAGVELAGALGAKVTAYYAIEPIHPIYVESYTLAPNVIEGIENGAREAGQKSVDAIGKWAKAAGVPFASVVANAATPDEGIIAVAKKRKCDVIFMSSHGRRGLSRLIMGSVTQSVLSHSRIPVVVYR